MEDTGTTQERCTHFWVIDSPNGRTSSGKCKLCGEIKEFNNYWHDLTAEHRPSSDSDQSTFAEAVSAEE